MTAVRRRGSGAARQDATRSIARATRLRGDRRGL